ncbi:hypothetical protein GCM10023257_11420 [Streptomyces hyderabadensis]|uniref:Uncharacterized protein n=1 Tax=Streptomyces hyderabadensis TaxID=598549 RepID=A0ABP9HR84_9ACTN
MAVEGRAPARPSTATTREIYGLEPEMTDHRIIAVEEHFTTPEFLRCGFVPLNGECAAAAGL